MGGGGAAPPPGRDACALGISFQQGERGAGGGEPPSPPRDPSVGAPPVAVGPGALPGLSCRDVLAQDGGAQGAGLWGALWAGWGLGQHVEWLLCCTLMPCWMWPADLAHVAPPAWGQQVERHQPRRCLGLFLCIIRSAVAPVEQD